MAYQKAFLYECTSVQFPGNHSITTNDLDLEQKIKGILNFFENRLIPLPRVKQLSFTVFESIQPIF